MQSRAITGHRGLLVLPVFLGILMAAANELTIQLIPPEPQVNQPVILNITGITDTILFSEWYRGKDIQAANQIIRYNRGGQNNNGDKHFKGAEIYGSGSLRINNFTDGLEGDYTVYIQGSTKSYQQTVSLMLPDKIDDKTTTSPPLDKDEPSPLGGGAIAGIVIGVISALVALVGVVMYLIKKKESGPL